MADSPDRAEPAKPAGPPRADERHALELARELAAVREQLNIRTLQLEQTEAVLWQMSVLFSQVSIPIVLLDRSGVVTDMNDEAGRILGKSRNELLGRRLSEALPTDRHELASRLIAECVAGRTVRNAAGELWGKSGELDAARTILFPLFDQHGKVVGAALAEDVRELKETGNLLEDVNRELKQLALVDGLTQLANRRHFERIYDSEIHRAARSGATVAVAMIDIDAFKNYNDALGHSAGDACLKAVGAALSSCLRRPADFIARYGGEEFVALMPNTSPEGAVAIAESMRRNVEALHIEHPDSPAADCVTISVGVASARIRGSRSRVDLRTAADEALYAAKRSGRNRVRAVSLTPAGVDDAGGRTTSPM